MNAKAFITHFLQTNGITRRENINDIVNGFDLTKPVYLQRLEPGDRVFQYVRNPSGEFSAVTGKWFCLNGATMNSLAIFGGGSGRTLKEFEVIRSIEVLEGTASSLETNWKWAGGGTGGATQLFVPHSRLFSLKAVSPKG